MQLDTIISFSMYSRVRIYVHCSNSIINMGINNSTSFSVPSSVLNFTLFPVTGSPTSLSTTWSVPIPRNGIITGYTVYCNTSTNQSFPEQVIGPNIPTIRSVVNGTTLAVPFTTGLNPYTQYSCYVTANTSAGEGNPSVIVTTRTVEGGEVTGILNPVFSIHV